MEHGSKMDWFLGMIYSKKQWVYRYTMVYHDHGIAHDLGQAYIGSGQLVSPLCTEPVETYGKITQ